MAGSNGMKQALAAYGPEQESRDPGSKSFTASLSESLLKLNTGRPFSVHRLHEELLVLKQHDASLPRLTNGTNKSSPEAPERTPIFFNLTPGTQSLSLTPLPSSTAQLHSPPRSTEADGKDHASSREDKVISPESVVDLIFDEARVLVCTTFVGDASPDMAYFNQWLHNTPPAASKITVEGMFLGPPTMLLISMPHSIWNVVQHDKVCCFLGYINSHNMIHLYKKLAASGSVGTATAKEVEDGRILLEAREAAATSRRDTSGSFPETPLRPDHHSRDSVAVSHAQSATTLQHSSPSLAGLIAPKDDVEDSAEMQEAAEQLKALSHVRHASGETPSNLDRHSAAAAAADNAESRQHDSTSISVDVAEPAQDDSLNGSTFNSITAKSKPRKSLQKQTPKQETRCSLCSHAPFKDFSTLRKHIAAAHTRPFPCAFSFAGCTSTFGSKNEWKRHIASQHLCLQYYVCSSCPGAAAEGKGNEFNRKDLFTQHLRRMHAPFAIKKAIAKGNDKLQVEWETHVKEMQQSCLVTRRQPPQRSACPRPDCQTVFEGPGSWDEWTEHVGRHMEKGEAQRLGVDRLLAKWALDEGIIERKEDGEYRLCSGPSGGGEGDHNGSFISDAGRPEVDDPSNITVAMPVQDTDTMETD
jgi:hypothetical protein